MGNDGLWAHEFDSFFFGGPPRWRGGARFLRECARGEFFFTLCELYCSKSKSVLASACKPFRGGKKSRVPHGPSSHFSVFTPRVFRGGLDNGILCGRAARTWLIFIYDGFKCLLWQISFYTGTLFVFNVHSQRWWIMRILELAVK